MFVILNIRSAGDVVLSRRQQQSQLPIYDDEPLSARWSSLSLRKRSETSSLRRDRSSIICASCPYFPEAGHILFYMERDGVNTSRNSTMRIPVTSGETFRNSPLSLTPNPCPSTYPNFISIQNPLFELGILVSW